MCAARRAKSGNGAGNPTCADSIFLCREMPSAALLHSWSNTVPRSHRSESSGIDMPRMRSSSGLPKSLGHLVSSLILRERICIITSRRARTVLITCSMSICTSAPMPRTSTVSGTPGLMVPAGACATRRRVVMRVVRRTETVRSLGLPEPAAAINNSSARAGLALMALWRSVCLELLLKARPGKIRPSKRLATSMTIDSALRARLLARAHDCSRARLSYEKTEKSAGDGPHRFSSLK